MPTPEFWYMLGVAIIIFVICIGLRIFIAGW